ncbi:S8 family peptidase [Flavobacterium microcysteis]|uniref:S8 family peptidase n=1 Tax=Flavobacterium microcysteis TaxID=2596891 RepID=A0A501PZY5_9FLAO|nr:S8 family peptidase [Flavobacterium microcysteis]TPD65738.1 S8 family peptidase [Flavobacterium microcysteis]
MADFPHLKLPFKVEGRAMPKGGGTRDKQALERTLSNKNNRQNHGTWLKESMNTVASRWVETIDVQKAKGIELPNTTDIPVFLRVDTEVFNIDSFKHWGIEIISEEEGGYIIGASTDNFKAFGENIDAFLNETGQRRDKAAQIWELVTDDSWRLNELLHGEIGNVWGDIQPDVIYTVQLGVSCYVPNKESYPVKDQFDSELKFQDKVYEYRQNEQELSIQRDAKQIKRETEVEYYVDKYSGEIHEIWDNEVDAFFFKISICGEGLRDIVHTYQYLYEVKLDPNYNIGHEHINLPDEYDIDIEAPDDNASTVCIIDSGIQENHRLLAASINQTNSRSYVENDASVADYVKQNGHGTKVAGAVLYPIGIPTSGKIKLESYIQNARILDSNNKISSSRFEPALMEQIVADYEETRIFNLSVCEDVSYTGTHMPALAASIDKLIHENDILFIVAAGNLYQSSSQFNNPGIKEHFSNGKIYPDYLNEATSKLANPGVSYFAITVGSIGHEDFEDADYKSLAGKNYISPFSRTGLGLWGCIKPDVVEYGGDLAKNKSSNELVINNTICPELVNSTMYGASAVGKDSYGTSFSTPKVSYIASRLQTEHPNETAQMYRALIIQSARLPQHCFEKPTSNDFRYYGYGIPNIDRALSNTTSRITFIQNGNIAPKKADIYHIKVPSELRGEGKEFRILVEVTLAFTAKTRLTRRGSHSYLSNWLEWQSSRYNENFGSFRNRTIEYLEGNDGEFIDEGSSAIKWVLRENPVWGNNGINRNNSSVQKSWAILEPQQFADEFSIAVIGHLGWDKSLENETEYAFCVSFELLDAEMNIYELMAQAQIEVQPEQEIDI